MSINNYNESRDLVSNSFNNIKVEFRKNNSQTLDFLKELYQYPPQFKIKWEQLDELNLDPKVKNSTINSNSKIPQSVLTSQKYTLKEYKNGFLNKLYTNKFYKFPKPTIGDLILGVFQFMSL
jgi:hypothetical protein